MTSPLRNIAIGVVAAAAMTTALPGAPALAANSVSCNQDGALKVHYRVNSTVGSAKCYGGSAGPLAVSISNVHRFEAGSRKATFNYEAGGRLYSRTMNAWTSMNINAPRVYEIRIW